MVKETVFFQELTQGRESNKKSSVLSAFYVFVTIYRALRTSMGPGNNRAEWPPSSSPAAAKNIPTHNLIHGRDQGSEVSEDIRIGDGVGTG